MRRADGSTHAQLHQTVNYCTMPTVILHAGLGASSDVACQEVPSSRVLGGGARRGRRRRRPRPPARRAGPRWRDVGIGMQAERLGRGGGRQGVDRRQQLRACGRRARHAVCARRRQRVERLWPNAGGGQCWVHIGCWQASKRPDVMQQQSEQAHSPKLICHMRYLDLIETATHARTCPKTALAVDERYWCIRLCTLQAGGATPHAR